jgi:hypothetical protein
VSMHVSSNHLSRGREVALWQLKLDQCSRRQRTMDMVAKGREA